MEYSGSSKIYTVLESGMATIKQPQTDTFVCLDESDFGPEQQEFLLKILSALGIKSLDEIGIITIKSGANISLSRHLAKAQKVVVFGLQPQQIGFHIRIGKYQPFPLNGVKCLMADSLTEIAEKQSLKRDLWSAIQIIFK
jgi:hypothetical protein